jgi:uncharacterized protein (TIGR03790 family)
MNLQIRILAVSGGIREILGASVRRSANEEVIIRSLQFSPFLRLWTRLHLPFAVCSFLSCFAAVASASEADSTLVIYNPNFDESQNLAEYYASKRNIPKDQVIALPCSTQEEIERDDYDHTIVEPLRNEFEERHWWTLDRDLKGQTVVTSNKIRFIALIRGVPLKIRFRAHYEGDHPDPTSPLGLPNEKAVDSELATIGFFRRQISGPMRNPYLMSFTSAAEADPRLMFVARLDAPSAADVRRMIDDSLRAERNGLWGWTYIDARGTQDQSYKVADDWLFDIAGQSFESGRPAILDKNESLFPFGYPMTNAILYFGWYSYQSDGVFRDPNFRFLPGAIAVHIHSFSGATVRHADQNWVGPLIEHGAAATLGNVYEPFLRLTPALNVFHDRLTHGMTFAESAYSSLLAVSWMTTIVGDPLYRPFGGETKTSKTTNQWAQFQELAAQYDDAHPTLIAELKKRDSGLFYEIAGLLEARSNQEEEAIKTLERAENQYKSRAERFRCVLDRAELLRTLNKADQLEQLIRRSLPIFPDDNAQSILKSYRH